LKGTINYSQSGIQKPYTFAAATRAIIRYNICHLSAGGKTDSCPRQHLSSQLPTRFSGLRPYLV